MMPYKLDPSCAYSYTDSVFTKDTLGIIEEGKELGKFKDELGGINIKEATFLGIKQYGYTYEKDANLVEKSVFAGVTRNSLTYQNILDLRNGTIIQSKNKLRFYKSFINLSIQIKEVNIKIKQNNTKTLVDNKYIPLNINLVIKSNILDKVLKLFKKFN